MTEPDFSDPRRPERRLAYRAAVDRPRLTLPNGRHVAIWPVVTVEHWLIDAPMPRQILVAPTGAPLLPDLANWGWHEYGMRVEFWRVLEAFAARGLRPTLSINGSVCEAYSVELNDIPPAGDPAPPRRRVRRPRPGSGRAPRGGGGGPLGGAKVMGFAVHPDITGVPHRIGLLERLLDALRARDDVRFAQGGALVDWYRGTGDDA